MFKVSWVICPRHELSGVLITELIPTSGEDDLTFESGSVSRAFNLSLNLSSAPGRMRSNSSLACHANFFFRLPLFYALDFLSNCHDRQATGVERILNQSHILIKKFSRHIVQFSQLRTSPKAITLCQRETEPRLLKQAPKYPIWKCSLETLLLNVTPDSLVWKTVCSRRQELKTARMKTKSGKQQAIATWKLGI